MSSTVFVLLFLWVVAGGALAASGLGSYLFYRSSNDAKSQAAARRGARRFFAGLLLPLALPVIAVALVIKLSGGIAAMARATGYFGGNR